MATVHELHPQTQRHLPPPAIPMAVARRLLEGEGPLTHEGQPTIRHWRDTWLTWRGSHWAELSVAELRALLYAETETATYTHTTPGGQPSTKPWSPNRTKIANLGEALAAAVNLPDHLEPPTWLDGDGPSVISVANGLLHADRNRALTDHTPQWFSRAASPVPWRPDAPQPAAWLTFLSLLWPGDPASVDCLQEWAGYLLSGRTDAQKILLLVGPPRSGKGTIARILRALVGPQHTANPTMGSLTENFGLQPLIGRSLAVIGDARLAGGPATSVLVERLLSVSGEDAITIDRKNRDQWTGTLPTRFTIVSNELPRLTDASAAIATRLLPLRLTRSWLGEEDAALSGRLLAELPGILAWSLDGLDRLTSNGRFTVPESSADAMTDITSLASPVMAFARECCDTTDRDASTEREKLYAAWKEWASENGHQASSLAVFGRNLKAAVPGVGDARKGPKEGPRSRHWTGIQLTPETPGHDRGCNCLQCWQRRRDDAE